MISLPNTFKENILSLYPEEAGYFFEAISNSPVTSIRLNKNKFTDSFEKDKQVDWCPLGRYLSSRPSFTEDPGFHAGAYYVQESSSMFLHQIVQSLPLPEQTLALDVCAAPGGKSTLLLDALPEDSLMVSNEIIKGRIGVLQENLIRWGASNSLVSNNDPKHFQRLGEVFDLILVDAPCSGEGLWRRDPDAMKEWSPEAVTLCAGRQERILQDILPALKPGGFLVYSTCTFNQTENEDQVEKLLAQLKPFPPQISQFNSVRTKDGFQFKFLPHLVQGEGLFIAVLQKPDNSINQGTHQKRTSLNFIPKKILPELHSWLNQPESFDYFYENDWMFAFPKHWIQTYDWLRQNLYIRQAGICLGKLDKSGQLIPEHSLAMSQAISNSVNKVELDKENALKYLRRDQVSVQTEQKSGWCLASYKNLNLGWMKVLPNRINNYFPAEYRILKDIVSV